MQRPILIFFMVHKSNRSDVELASYQKAVSRRNAIEEAVVEGTVERFKNEKTVLEGSVVEGTVNKNYKLINFYLNR